MGFRVRSLCSHASASLPSSMSLVLALPSCCRPQVPHLQRKKEFTYHRLHLKHSVLRNVGTSLGFSPGHITPWGPWDSVKVALTYNCLKSAVYSGQKFLYRKSSCCQMRPNEQKKTKAIKTQRPPRRGCKGLPSHWHPLESQTSIWWTSLHKILYYVSGQGVEDKFGPASVLKASSFCKRQAKGET